MIGNTCRSRARVRRAQLDSYVERVVDRYIAELGANVRNPWAVKRSMAADAAAPGTTTTYAKIATAASPGTRDQPSLTAYRDALERLFILDSLPGWLPNTAHLSELAASPRHYLADPALAVTLLGLDEDALLSGDDRGGSVFRDGPRGSK